MVENVIIIGSGPAGYTAAIYAARSKLKPLLIDGPEPGGQLTITGTVENFPGHPEGVTGPKLMLDMRAQALRYGTRFLNGEVTSVDFSEKIKKINIGDQILESKAVIISTGASAQWLGLEEERKLIGKGVSGCATCDGFFFKNQNVVVVGGGDTAVEEAVFMTKFAKKVTIIHRRDKLRASKLLQDRVTGSPKIEFAWNKVVVEINDVKLDKVTGVRVKDVKTAKISEVPCEGVFVAIGRKPKTAIFQGKLKLDDQGYIVTKKSSMETNVPGVFAAGDVQDSEYRQAVLAAGTGCMAAIDAERYLSTC